jgi:hypothetical protein
VPSYLHKLWFLLHQAFQPFPILHFMSPVVTPPVVTPLVCASLVPLLDPPTPVLAPALVVLDPPALSLGPS